MQVDEDTIIIDEASKNNDQMFIIKDGIAKVARNSGLNMYASMGGVKLVEKRLKPGEIFGEIAVLYNCPRSATIKSVTKMLLWTIKEPRF